MPPTGSLNLPLHVAANPTVNAIVGGDDERIWLVVEVWIRREKVLEVFSSPSCVDHSYEITCPRDFFRVMMCCSKLGDSWPHYEISRGDCCGPHNLSQAFCSGSIKM